MGEPYEEVDQGDSPEPTLLIVGDGEPLVDGIADAASRHGLAVEHCSLSLCAQTAVAVAPDAVLLVGDAVKDGGTEALRLLSASPLAAVVPVVLFGDEEEDLGERLTAFRLGATAFISRSASVDATAQRLAELMRNMPERSGPQIGRLGEASLDSFVHTIARELRHGILSVRGVDEKGSDEEIRLVLGEGQGLTEAIRDFIGRVQQLIERTEVVHYEWQEDARGVSLLSSLGEDDEGALPSIAGTRVLLADDDPARADVVSQELRNLGALVAVVDPQGRGLSRARALDPHALVVGQRVVHGPGLELVRKLRGDARMRWAHMIVVPWEEVWSDGEAPPQLDSLVRRIARATKVEKAIHERVASKKTFDVRLEALGAARLLRQLGLEQGTIRLTVWNLRGTVRVDVGQGLVIGARAMVPGKAGGVRDGTPGLACLLPMASGRARIEHVSSPMTTNVMSPVEVALGQAEDEIVAGPPEAPPHTLQQKAGGSMYPVAVARTEPPPARRREEGDEIEVSVGSIPPDEVVPTPAIVVAPLAPKSAVIDPPTKTFAIPDDVEDAPPEPAPPPVRKRIPKQTMVGVAPPSANAIPPAAMPTPPAGNDRVAQLRALAGAVEAERPKQAWKPPPPKVEEPPQPPADVEDQAPEVGIEPVRPPRPRKPLPKPARPLPPRLPEPAARAPEPEPEPPSIDIAEDEPTSVDAYVPIPEPREEPPAPIVPPPMLHAIPPPVLTEEHEEPSFDVRISEPAVNIAPRAPAPRGELDTTMRTPRSPARRRRVWVWPVAALVLAGAIAGAAWWTGYPPQAFEALGIAPRTAGAPVARASRAPTPVEVTEPATPEPEPEQPEVATAPEEEEVLPPEAGTTDENDEAPDDEWVTRERPTRPHRPPTPLHAVPEGADESFAVPEWMSELGPITRERRSRELRDMGERNLRNRRYDRALTWFRRSWWFQENADTAAGIAGTLLAMGDSDQALRWAQHAVELNADDADALVILGDALRAEGRLREARVSYEQALEIQPRNRDAQRNLRRIRRLQRLDRRRGRAG